MGYFFGLSVSVGATVLFMFLLMLLGSGLRSLRRDEKPEKAVRVTTK
jgi:hypothetical protein